MNKKKTKKLIKYNRGHLEQSTPIKPQKNNNNQPYRQHSNKVNKKQKSKKTKSSQIDEIGMPASWKGCNPVIDIKNKLLMIVSDTKPLLGINQMYQNQQQQRFENTELNKIFGGYTSSFRKTFKYKQQISYENNQDERRESANVGQMKQVKHIEKDFLFFQENHQSLGTKLLPDSQQPPQKQEYVNDHCFYNIVVPNSIEENEEGFNFLNMIIESDNQFEQRSELSEQIFGQFPNKPQIKECTKNYNAFRQNYKNKSNQYDSHKL